MLEQEQEYYNANKALWMTQYPNKYVLIKGTQLLGFFDSEDQAISEGVRQLGLTSLLVRKVGEVEQEVVIPALTLGLLSANTSQPE